MHATVGTPNDFDHVEFVSDYQLQGLRNHYHNYGLGVPLIAVRRPHDGEDPGRAVLSAELEFSADGIPACVVARRRESGRAGSDARSSTRRHWPAAMRHIADPRGPPRGSCSNCTTRSSSRRSTSPGAACRSKPTFRTPLAYFLNQPQFQDSKLSTDGPACNPGEAKKLQGLYMLEPYDPDKMPVVMVHGLWSSPVTWMEMFNDLRSDPAGPRALPVLVLPVSDRPAVLAQRHADARRPRHDAPRSSIPSGDHPALDQMVLVGHSMGGLVSKMQTVDSGDAFWQTTSEHPFAELKADDDVDADARQRLLLRPEPVGAAASSRSARRIAAASSPTAPRAGWATS